MKKILLVLLSFALCFPVFSSMARAAGCGTIITPTQLDAGECTCQGGNQYNRISDTQVCCGFYNTTCNAEPTLGSAPETVGPINLEGLNKAIFGQSGPNPLFKQPRGIISYLLPFLFTLAGIILFIMIIWGGFEMLMGAADPKSQEAGKARITAGLIGFLIIFASYWLAQLLQVIFGISILG